MAALRTLSRRGPPVQIRSRALPSRTDVRDVYAHGRIEPWKTSVSESSSGSNPVPRTTTASPSSDFCPGWSTMEYNLPLTLSRCTESVGDEIDLNRGIVVIPKTHGDVLTEKQLINYKENRLKFLLWLLNVGKNPSKAKGYSPHTVYGTAYRTARFDKWRWENCGGYSMPPTSDEAAAFVEATVSSSTLEEPRRMGVRLQLRQFGRESPAAGLPR